MDTKQAIKTSLAQADFIWTGYLADLTDKDLLTRACKGSNHIAWQLGHLIQSERYFIDKIAPGKATALPGDFNPRHTKEMATVDEGEKFLKKDDYIKYAKQVRADALKVLDSLSEADLAKPAGPGMPPFLKSVGDVFVFLGSHWIMHAGQWAIIRRSIGKPPLF